MGRTWNNHRVCTIAVDGDDIIRYDTKSPAVERSGDSRLPATRWTHERNGEPTVRNPHVSG
jgi:hypothetical protein